MPISLCITCYDGDHHYLHSLLPSIEKQTVLPTETIVVCSGATHLEINTNLPQFQIHYNQHRKNAAWARNKGAELAQNEIIVFFDVDDIPHPQKIEATIHHIKDFDYLFHSYNTFKNRKQPPQKYTFDNIDIKSIQTYTNITLPKSQHVTNIVCENKKVHHAHIAVKKKIFDTIRFNENSDKERMEDSLFCQDLIRNNFRGVFLDYPFVRYRQ